ncbi:uncharacterized protein LACBIDRAFT_309882 [Laccaria bicolor S238N-H82]|uniref:Predicted protein n=1 Tax=Laccaria bicolor (strain S238N-H82 / ATCC MYA-4686) TaxID=486041 RepID=B0DT94_LACBS|nr:uncharacterized protein LACBIDRAFT_309882 [Laccaria bicolor S238N-H82]EDR02238.1 predicted protein [Laccaria bicolor S238N-H82]|eukprot:XP_001887183.1 predicted protein [Laccaria bicolor S238N-H82]
MSGSDAKFELFPAPSHLDKGGLLPPRVWPGRTPASIATLRQILKDNHEKWHIYFNTRGFHNHAAHTVIALWALGANEEILNAAYRYASSYLLPLFESPGLINEGNWETHLGDEKYYQAYISFFTEEVKAKGVDAVLEEYVFATSANYVSGQTEQPQMLGRLLDAVIHPLIHVGYGVEFGLPGMVIEGLAWTAVHKGFSTSVLTQTLFSEPAPEKKDHPTHAFTVLGRVISDPRLANNADPQVIKEYVDQWQPEGDVAKHLEELLWVNSLVYGVAGLEEIGQFNADFFYMHLVTSSIFLPSLCARLTERSQTLFLRSYFLISLSLYVERGRPALDIPRFFANDTTLHPADDSTPHAEGLVSLPSGVTPNPWLSVIQTSLVHHDEHVPKLQRALCYLAELFGGTPAGYFKNTELKDAELVDGTLFVRTANLSAKRTGRGEVPSRDVWDRRGFFQLKA